MKADLISDRLIDQCASLAWVKPALKSGTPAAYPAAYTLVVSESADSNPLIGAWSQIVTTRFAVEYMVTNQQAQSTGGPAQDDLEGIRDAGKAALIGWAPEAEYDGCTFTGGRLIELTANMVIWRDEFTTTKEFRQ